MKAFFRIISGALSLASLSLIAYVGFYEIDPFGLHKSVVQSSLIDQSEYARHPCSTVLEPSGILLPDRLTINQEAAIRLQFKNLSEAKCKLEVILPAELAVVIEGAFKVELGPNESRVLERAIRCREIGACVGFLGVVSEKPRFEQSHRLEMFSQSTLLQLLSADISVLVLLVGGLHRILFWVVFGRNHSKVRPTQRFYSSVVRSWAPILVGRMAELRVLRRFAGKEKVVVVFGPSGVGKTELVLQWYQRYAKKSMNGGLWVDCVSSPDLQLARFAASELIIDLAEIEKMESRIPEGGARQRGLSTDLSDSIYRRWAPKKGVIVFDNVTVERLDELPLPPIDVADQFLVIVIAHRSYQTGAEIQLKPLAEAEAVRLLFIHARKLSKTNDSEAKALVAELNYLPLAIELVGRYVQMHDESLQRVRKAIEARALEAGPLIGVAQMTTAHPSLRAAFEFCWHAMPESGRELGTVIAALQNEPIPMDWFQAADTADEHLAGLSALLRYGFAEKRNSRNEPSLICIHNLTYEFLQAMNVGKDKALPKALIENIPILEVPVPLLKTSDWLTVSAPWIPHLQTIERWVKSHCTDRWLRLLLIITEYSLTLGRPRPVIDRLSELMTKDYIESESEKGLHSRLLISLGWAFRFEHDYEHARKAYMHGVALLRRRPDLTGQAYQHCLAITFNDLGNMYREIGKIARGRMYLQRSLKLRRSLVKHSSADYSYGLADTLHNVALDFIMGGAPDVGMKLLAEVIDIRTSLVEIDYERHASALASDLSTLAIIYKNRKEYDKGLKALQASLRILYSLKKRGAYFDPLLEFSASSNLGEMYYEMGKPTKACATFVKTLETAQDLARQNPLRYRSLVGVTHFHLAEMYRASSRFRSAYRHYRFANEVFANCDKNDPVIARGVRSRSFVLSLSFEMRFSGASVSRSRLLEAIGVIKENPRFFPNPESLMEELKKHIEIL